MRGDGFLSFPLFPRPAWLSNTLLALLVVTVSGLMVAPLPSWLLDILLAANLAFSLLVLLAAISARDVTRLAGFPTIFLIATLVRLALLVAASRLILLEGNAGQVISAFGHFLIRNSYIAGMVIFVTLVVIQIVVIAKGSERSAEVAARFALDGLPGRQMAIDADLRSNAISNAEARRRREHLTTESQLYGAMDGALKFIKGDVVASLVVTLVTIVGGVSLGVLQQKLTALDAVRRYGLLGLGAGLVIQISALIVATAGGILVTRVASNNEPASFAQSEQASLANPTELRIAALAALGLAVLPGLPGLPFVLVAAGLGIFSLLHDPRSRSEATRTSQATAASQPRSRFASLATPWSLEVSQDLAPLIVERGPLRERLQSLRTQFFQDLGVALPDPALTIDSKLPSHQALLSIWEVPDEAIDLPNRLTADERIAALGSRVETRLRARAADFIGLAETQLLLDQLEQHAPVTVQRVVPHPIRLPLLTEILRRLVAEGVGIRDLRAILEALAQARTDDKDPGALADFIRNRLQRSLTHQVTQGASRLDVIVLDPVVEDTIRDGIARSDGTSELCLAPAVSRDLIAATRRAVEQGRSAPGVAPVVLAAPDIRRFVRQLLVTDFPELRVISPNELLPELALNPIETINVRGI